MENITSNKLNGINNISELADILEISLSQLKYLLFVIHEEKKYDYFIIPKKSGGEREIYAPNKSLKFVQQKINELLAEIYKPKNVTHGYAKGRNVKTNALCHTKKRNVLNVDLENFFPTINFGRVLGALMSPPFSIKYNVATLIAKLCCHHNFLPQGAPTSPILSNIICRKLDNDLIALARKYKCSYTRYADDITFSTSTQSFPIEIVRVSGYFAFPGEELSNIIKANGFDINYKKVRLSNKYVRQEVTGLVVNKIVNVKREYVRQLRAMIHAYEKYGLDRAQSMYNFLHHNYYNKNTSFEQIIKGKLEYLKSIKGKTDPVFLNYAKRLYKLNPTLVNENLINSIDFKYGELKPCIFTEGKTDAEHLLIAKDVLKIQQYTEIPTFNETRGEDVLKKMCESHAKGKSSELKIFLFDRDIPRINKEMTADGKNYKKWNKNIYSAVIPIPSHRNKTPEISIEFFYQNKDLILNDRQGRRLYFNNEFNPRSGRHIKDDTLNCVELSKIVNKNICIVDNKVYNKAGDNVALSKNDFVELIANNRQKIDFSEFRLIFNLLDTIVEDAYASIL